jgi:hypothetical protein
LLETDQAKASSRGLSWANLYGCRHICDKGQWIHRDLSETQGLFPHLTQIKPQNPLPPDIFCSGERRNEPNPAPIAKLEHRLEERHWRVWPN